MGGRGSISASGQTAVLMPGDDGYGVSTPDGSMRKAIAWHGSSAEFDEFDGKFANERHQNYGEGFYLTANKDQARLYGKYTYEVEITYSTNNRAAKKTGREQDFQYSPDTGYWVIPHNKASNLRIISRKKNTGY